MKYDHVIMDPTGNITALVYDSADDPDSYAGIAGQIMNAHPEVEQVGFIRESQPGEYGNVILRMAGGEFCGNASMCAAAWYAAEHDIQSGKVLLDVSGSEEIVLVRITKTGAESFHADVCMPPALGIDTEEFEYDGRKETIPLVRYVGIYHLIIEDRSPFFSLMNEKEKAEEAVRKWCGQINAPGLGLMFVKPTEAGCRLTPLVYIPGSDTLFWEHSCASGSSAVCVYIADKEGRRVSLRLSQPGGVLKAESDPKGLETWLSGKVKLI